MDEMKPTHDGCEHSSSPTPRDPGGVHSFNTGAVRGTDANGERYDLITPIGLRRLAETYAEGASKYGDNNWLKGIPATNLLNHAYRHMNKYLAGDTTEDHLAHAAWNLMAVMHFEETRPELIDVLARQPRQHANGSVEPAIWNHDQ